jgi:linoleoyl-CoA desaturase
MVTPKFSSSALSLHSILKKNINTYLAQNKISPQGNYKLYVKAAVLLSCYIFLYIHLVFFTPVTWFAITECVLLGLVTATIGFNIMHDGAHGSFSKHQWLNKIAASSLDFLGASSFMWNMKHNVIHHAYTNIDGVDDDINATPFLRLSNTQKHYKIHRYQYIYCWLLYCFLYLFWIFFTDYRKYFTHKVGNVPLPNLKLKNHIFFWLFKLLYISLYILLPIYLCGFIQWFTGFLIYSGVAGFILSIVFQLAHTVDETSIAIAIQPLNRIEDEWAVHQLKSTANFSMQNKFITWFVGGLNFQIEHHLFPKISHIHYPVIAKIVKQTCLQSGVLYIEHTGIFLAIASHIQYLKKMGSARPYKHCKVPI